MVDMKIRKISAVCARHLVGCLVPSGRSDEHSPAGGAVGGTYASTGGAGGTSTSPTGIGSLIAGGGSAASADGTRDRAVRGTVPSWTRTAGPRPMTAAPSVDRRTGPRWRWAKKSGPPRARWSISLARRRWNRSPRFPHN